MDVNVELFTSEKSGRGLKAKRNLNPGSTVLSSEPYAYLLSKKQKGVYCDFCFKKQDGLLQCSGCKYMKYCNRNCQKMAWNEHHKAECPALKNVMPKRPPDFVILLGRLLWNMQQYSSAKLPEKNSILDLESNYNKLSQNQKEALMNFLVILHTFWSPKPLPPQVTDNKMLLELCARIKNNSFAICNEELQSDVGTGVYLNCSFINHSCEPNCVAEFNMRTLKIRAVKNITAGEEVLISYVDLFATSFERQRELMSIYHFQCTCHSCNAKTDDDQMMQDFDGKITESKLSSVKDMLSQMEELRKQCDYQKIKDLVEGCVKRKILPHENIYMAKVLDFGMDACIELGVLTQAFEFGSMALFSYKLYLHANHPMLGIQLMKLGKILLHEEKNQDAMQFLREAFKILTITHSPNSSVLTELQNLLGQCLAEMQN
uniref:[histone H3]-lysine(4) N-trimethyltransferase n=1 Tax=Ciona intestinalis TaxID=7719 RepID=F6RQ08_CIOIN|nr:histone-lysine N-methyltransferase SMYD3 [Ciona intestinalis]|eukprot:XP_002128556.1 histone-lysine N-methyltransferase SMYD3 [Ciona intestinalis]